MKTLRRLTLVFLGFLLGVFTLSTAHYWIDRREKQQQAVLHEDYMALEYLPESQRIRATHPEAKFFRVPGGGPFEVWIQRDGGRIERIATNASAETALKDAWQAVVQQGGSTEPEHQ